MRQSFDETTDPSFGAKHLPQVRARMAEQGLDGFLVPHEDEHQNEYLPEANDRLAWLTGFTGSAGAGVVLKDRAAVFADGRYTVQVRAQVDPAQFEILDLVEGGVPAYLEKAPKGAVIGYDPRLHSPDALAALKRAAAKAGAELKAVDVNPLDLAWGDARPAQPTAPVVPHLDQYAGESAASKRRRIGAAIEAKGADCAVLTAPASLAWLFNIRGGDVIRTPLPLGQAIVHANGTAKLFLDPRKVTNELPGWLGEDVTLETAATVEAALADLGDRRVLIDPAQSAAWWFDRLEAAGATIVRAMDPCTLPRAAKNPVEIEGSRQAHIRDGAALARFLHWVDTVAQETLPDEREVAEALERFREETGALQDLSFDTIAGAGPNGALPHYKPVTRTLRRMEKGSLLLVDGGGQYLDGTTDVTRTVAIGEPSADQRRMFTLVLKGHIAMATVRFPVGTTGHQLDALARLPMWMAGLDYDHGTGHGVGSYLGVHEGPQRIAKLVNTQPLLTGMILSNEPGYYREGHWGIRIETLQVVTEPTPIPGGERPMHGFEQLTFAPLDRRLIDVDLLTPDERAYVDAYHAETLARVGPLLDGEVRGWLERQCAPL
ncbi:MAG: aminopeptidase P family protein [Alphaproteobacteria bacterium]|nr:aminopeptidase P family protein [Alphaproteobacteria bacterium]MBU1525266.1 aminopeptidase P family protein [Alphaproteobacteria bacterium]MBU2117456.1 aminopeptidase P family protein [Alphaproteobacteria bacterium]MBU2351784.1 aminopeptidase P family protein [Alphaproteobacteria bacterium]MBU2382275.1 aminopeptidase P family protein [Alphaproteobacteria bacterium]